MTVKNSFNLTMQVEEVHKKEVDQCRIKGWREGRAPLQGSKFFRFHAVFGKNWQNRMLAPPHREGAAKDG